MLRFLHSIRWFVLLGLLSTIVVAWTCSIVAEVTKIPPEQGWSGDGVSRWLISRYRRPAAERVLWRPLFSPAWEQDPGHDRIPLEKGTQEMRRQLIHRVEVRPTLIPAWSNFGRHSPDAAFTRDRDLFDDVIIEDARGWPWLALRCTFGPQLVQGMQVRREVSGGLPVPTILLGKKIPASESKALPITPVWFGLLGDVGVFSLTWMIVLRTPRWVLGTWRRIRRRCPECGYQLRGLDQPRCPECGRARRRAV